MDDDNDLLDNDLIDNDLIDEESISEESSNQVEEPPINNSSVVDELLKRVGIKDRNNILFEDESGTIAKKWDEIDLETLLNILTNPNTLKDELNADEKELINTIRNSKMTPKEYQEFLIHLKIKEYANNNQQSYNVPYTIDDYDDDTLYIADIISKIGEENITDEELKEILDNAKSNPKLFEKLIQALRQEYKNREDEERNNLLQYSLQQQLERYNQFAETVETSIRNLTDISGMTLDMSEDEMEQLYDFIVGFDLAGISVFGKALNEPDTLVKMAWFALHGDEMISDLNNQFNNELKKQMELSYQKGLEEGKKNKNSGSLYINQNKFGNSKNYEDALDLV